MRIRQISVIRGLFSVIDKSTFEEPAKYSEGIKHVLVGGVFVVKEGKLQGDTNPGRAIRGTR